MRKIKYLLLFFTILSGTCQLSGQDRIATGWDRFWTPADTFHPARFWIAAGSGTVLYTATMIGLNEAWYKTYARTGFHLHNDWGEWRMMDKLGHAFTTYTESRILTQGARWAGIGIGTSRWIGTGVALGLQTSIEWLDGHSSQWGFSWPDMAFNGIGATAFLLQDLAWHDQRIILKVSNWLPSYPSDPLNELGGYSIGQRADALFGNAWPERYLKDYNAQNLWLSVNLRSFLPESKWPAWLNIAFGYSAENVWGGYSNSWTLLTGQPVRLDPATYPRYSQYILSLDIDFTRIPTHNAFLKALFQALNAFKFPFPGIEYNSLGKWQGKWIY